MKINSENIDIMHEAIILDDENSLPVIDAMVNVSISDNMLLAFIKITPPENGGAEVSLEEMLKALAHKKVTYNIYQKKLEDLADKPIYHRSIVIASGTAAINGENGSVVFKVETEKKALKPKEIDDGKVDYRDLGIVENVTKGQVLCEIKFPTEGVPGITVKGECLLQKPGKPAPNHVGKNTELSEDGTKIISKIDGQVEFKNAKINVNETYFVTGDVGNSTGNLCVSGNVVIRGGIAAGFVVEAGGDVDVYETVESASIKAGGDVKLRSGITGSKVICEGDLKSRFIEGCNVFVKNELNAEYILHSDIKCGKTLKVVGIQAKIIGGSCIVGQNIEAKYIGSVANAKTKLEIGTDPAIIERQQSLLAQIPKMEKQIDSLKPLLKLLRQLEAGNRLTPEKKDSLKDVSYSYDVYTKLLEDARSELNEISERLYVKGYGCVICTETIFPGTEVMIGGAKFSVEEAMKNTTLYYNKGLIGQRNTR